MISRCSRRRSALLAGLIALGALPFALYAQDVTCIRVEESPRIDGRLDDKAWQAAPVIDSFRMVEPRPGEDPSEKTEARIVSMDTASTSAFTVTIASRPDLGQHHGPRQRKRGGSG